MNQGDILILVKAGFTAEDIKVIAPEYFQHSASDSSIALPNGAASASSAAPAAGAAAEPVTGEPAPAEPAPAPAVEPAPTEPAPAPVSAPPAWFGEFVARYNADQARMERAIHAENIIRTDAHASPDYKTPEQLMAEAYHAIVD